MTDGGIIPFGGAGGNITIDATESVTISGSSANGIFPSSIISDTKTNNPAGNINLNTGTFLLEGEGVVSASSIGTGDGGNITINATESMQLSSNGINNFLILLNADTSDEVFQVPNAIGGLFSVTFEGNAGDINLTTPVLSLNNGSLISTATFGSGKGGNLAIDASQTVEIISSAIASSSINTGDAGNLKIDTGNLLLRNGGTLASATIGLGKPGNMTINATESVELSNDKAFISPFQGGIITSNSGGGLGRAGNLYLNTKNLIIRDGLGINIANEIPFQRQNTENIAIPNASAPREIEPGNSMITATESIEISGSSTNGTFTSSIKSNTETNYPANDIQIATPQLTISEGANITVSSNGKGAAGNLEIMADRIILKSGGTLNADTFSSQGGNINLIIADTLQMSDRARITTNALASSNGGNITIETNFMIAFPNSNITATAIAGQGGKIDIKAQEIFVASPNQISASSQLGIDGTIEISTFTNDLRNNITKLPEQTFKANERVVSRCGVGDEFGQSSFVYIGKGALPPSPLEGFSDDEFLVDWGIESSELELHSFNPPPKKAIVEANQWVVSDRGKIILIAEASSSSFLPHQITCPFK